MIILPAIDIKDGECVRLYQGDYGKVTTYDTDPARVAQRWQEAGASWLHVVDLDGAASGYPVNVELIGGIRAATSLRIEVGGGIRSLPHIEQVFDLGIERIVLGTIALTDRALIEEALYRWGERIAVGLDARDGRVATRGWRETSSTQATSLARELRMLGVRRFIYTDIARDGVLKGPNLEALAEMQRVITEPLKASPDTTYPTSALIASGGISALDDLHAIAELGVEGAIVGRAIYTGDVVLAAAIQEIERGGG
ncbi:MAG: 1-(5-phosphoribosyl)-5-[(5-phosphoribosylamino)methylideneamino]imidazole-4-carboxamide isomerase [Chloroflexi bacterium]|nr:MAG: 1-(5-phosphoribosyl)-5-[(5-phosphoribosylamino)methylideneamino]imidazole-4-carboxamide isomerase [Chloroflexota bacterium]